MKISMILNVALGIALVFLCYLVTIGKGKEKEQEQEQDSSEVGHQQYSPAHLCPLL